MNLILRSLLVYSSGKTGFPNYGRCGWRKWPRAGENNRKVNSSSGPIKNWKGFSGKRKDSRYGLLTAVESWPVERIPRRTPPFPFAVMNYRPAKDRSSGGLSLPCKYLYFPWKRIHYSAIAAQSATYLWHSIVGHWMAISGIEETNTNK